MKESELLGTLLPASPDFRPIIEAVREKYSLPEVSPDEEPITEIYLDDQLIPMEEFRQDIENRVRGNLDFLPPDTVKLYNSSKKIIQSEEIADLDRLPDDLKESMKVFVKFMQNMMRPTVQLLDAQIDFIVELIYIHLLTGDSLDTPEDWFSKVAVIQLSGEPTVIAMASEVANVEAVVQQFRAQHRKTFGVRPKITKTITSTAYYLQLKKARKPWNFIFEEYIRLAKISLPRDRSSQRYIDTRRKHEQRLKKRIQRTETVLDLLVKDKK